MKGVRSLRLLGIISCILIFIYRFPVADGLAISPKSKFRVMRKHTVKMTDTLLSLGAGSIAGVIGIGTAYPLDAIKTRLQTDASTRVKPEGVKCAEKDFTMLEMGSIILRNEGLKGFYGGVNGVMVGEAFVKATLFGANTFALTSLEGYSMDSFLKLCLAAAFSGFVSSFVLNPIERVKILMQADRDGSFSSELDCIVKVAKTDGVSGLLLRGLDGMMAREIPGCLIYFVAYTLLKESAVSDSFGQLAPFLCGGSAGVLAWIPIYPADVVKTYIQNTVGESKRIDMGYLETAIFLQRKYGFKIFFEGIQPKLYRAAVNHSVTFFVYDFIIRSLSR